MFTARELEQALEREVEDTWYEAEYVFKKGVRVDINGEPVFVKLVSHDSGIDEDYVENYKTNITIILEADGRLFRKTGYYQSFTGGDFDGPFEEVERFVRTVDDYRKI